MTDHEPFLRRAIEIATERRAVGGSPFASLLVDEAGTIIAEDHNTVDPDGDVTAHPELKLARWAASTLSPEAASATTMYTTCQPCEMCSGAIDRAGLRRVVYALSSQEFAALAPHQAVHQVPLVAGGFSDQVAEVIGDYFD